MQSLRTRFLFATALVVVAVAGMQQLIQSMSPASTVRDYLWHIPGVSVEYVKSVEYSNPQVAAKIHVENKGAVLFNSVWLAGNWLHPESSSSISEIGPCTFLVVRDKQQSRGYRHWLMLAEIPKLSLARVDDVVTQYDAIIATVSTWPPIPSDQNSAAAGYYATCK